MEARVEVGGRVGVVPACTDESALFFPTKQAQFLEAQAICETCAMKRECLAIARAHDTTVGVWGGVYFRDGKEHDRVPTRGRPPGHNSRTGP
jgi:hypothetical protein